MSVILNGEQKSITGEELAVFVRFLVGRFLFELNSAI